MAHTPGPWTFDRGGEYIKGGGHYLCDLLTTNDYDGHLMAAAPDLLAACEKALDWMTVGVDRFDGVPLGPVEDTLRTAIAKARGEDGP